MSSKMRAVIKYKTEYIGDEALLKRPKDLLNFQFPMTAGIVESWDDMEKIWHHTLYD